MTPTSGDPDAVTVSPTVLTFTTGDWATAQTVTVTAEEDTDANDETVEVTHAASSGDSAYSTLVMIDAVTVTVTVTDDEDAGVTVTPDASLMSPVDEGGTGTYTVVLASQPTDVVTVTPTSGDPDAVTVSPMVLTFTTGDWATAQTVTATAKEDTDANDETVEVSHAASSTDSAYNTLVIDAVTVTVTDNDTAGVTIAPDASLGSPVVEGGMGTYTVVLASEPTANVTVTATSGNSNSVSVLPMVLTFTTGDWSTAQTVTATAKEDANAISETVEVTHAAVSGDSAYNTSLVIDVVTVSVTDNDAAGVTIAPDASLGSPVVEGGTGTYTVVLASEPSASVTVTATSGDTDAVSVSPMVLTFTTGDWSTAQTVTATAKEDANAISETVEVTHAAVSGDSAYNTSLVIDVVTVSVTDNDAAGVTIVVDASLGSPVVEGGTGTYTVVLASEPSASVTVTATSGDTDAVSVSPMVLTFTTGNWSTAQTVTATAKEDANAISETVEVTHAAVSGDSAYNTSLVIDAVTVTVTDNDAAGVTIVVDASLGSPVVEGGTGTYTVVLASQPTASVTVTPTSGDTDAVSVSPMVLTFTTGNWSTAQTVTATAKEDADANDETVEVTHAASSTDSAYNTLVIDAVTVTVTDNDTAGVTVPSEPVNVSEGGTGTYTVVLASQPTASVTVTPTSGNSNSVTVSPMVLTFTTGNWSTAQTVTATAKEDMNAISETVEVTHAAVSGDSAYNTSLVIDAVTVTVTDNDAAGVTIVSSSPINVSEGGTGTYTVVLASQPTANVTVTATSGDTGAVTLTPLPTVLTFTTGNWSTAQTVTATAKEDINASDEEVEVTHAAVSTDSAYNTSLVIDVVTVMVTDNDAAGVTIVVDASLGSPVVEGGMGTYTVVLASQPTASVTVTPTSGNSNSVTVSPMVLTFTTGNWSTAQTVTATAKEDTNAISETVEVTHAAVSGDSAYNTSLVIDAVTVTVTDNDAAGVTIVSSSPINVSEGGTGTYTVVLASQPTANVTVTATSGDTGAVTLTPLPTVLTFTTGNWDTAQTVTATAVQDINANDEEVEVTHAADSTDSAYNASLVIDVVTVTVTDNDAAGVTIVSDASLNSPVVEGGTGTYTVVLASQPTTNVTVTATSGDTGAVTLTPLPTVLTFTTGDWSTAQTVTATAVQDTDANDEEVEVSHAASSTDSAYNNLTVDKVTVTVTDDGFPVVSVFFGASAYSVSEGGMAASVSVSLSAVPDREVVVPVTVTNQGDTSAGDYLAAPAMLTFAADVTEQSFTFTAVDDRVDDDGESVVLSFGTLPSGVSAGEPSTATVTIADDDTAGVTVEPDTGLSFDEDGTATYTVVLDSQPTGDVIVTVTLSLISGATRASYTPSVISGATRASYTPSVISGATRASYTPSVISGATRASYTPSVISGATRASYTPSVISGATRAWYTPSVISGATRAWYTLVAADVTEFLKAFVSPDAVTVSPSVLTFTSTNWDTAQTVTVRAVDGIVTDDETIEVSHTVTSADVGYDDFVAAKQTVRAAPPDPALSVGRLGLFWDNSTTGNSLWGDSCIGRRSFFVIWTGPEGNNKRADEWAAKISTHRGAGEVIYDFRETPGTTGYYKMYGTVEFQGAGSLSLNVRGRFGQRWGTWSPTGSLYCFEVQRPTRN